jgi:F0F1-type ATP synthase membrane subunit c/vacuolar-type H+-ATPase subunit K
MENILGLVALACGLIVGLGALGASIVNFWKHLHASLNS